MDAVSHALIGFSLAVLSGHQPAFSDPIFISTILGAQAPDLDIFTHIRGGMTYLKQHRASSHSFPGIIGWSLFIAISVHVFVSSADIMSLFLWAFVGGLSHILSDYANTHGAALLWPLKKERISCHLLNVFDPIILALLFVFDIYIYYAGQFSWYLAVSLFAYTLFRLFLKKQAYCYLKQYLKDYIVHQILIMPSLRHLFNLDFVVQTDQGYFAGRISNINLTVQITATFPCKKTSSVLISEAQKTPLGRFFRTFSPFAYFEEAKENNVVKVKIYDLRYILNHKFLHSATIIFNQHQLPVTSYLHTYGRNIKVPC
ncbi:hypothetical protein P22_3618 [Propionispora sp. 2/2-37]|uniref:metal-dependent hydrolase n=1 Tax=Propionispora sp. 2/2-37 TaxID=1677858 RepID=UPI0006BB6B65|nr:metal-dependent hydrolase [Propionispora sp. 2/2-37]CUH97487.1 hypothetical protein P22_3618 [Propionispora sp. 2/2-37]